MSNPTNPSARSQEQPNEKPRLFIDMALPLWRMGFSVIPGCRPDHIGSTARGHRPDERCGKRPLVNKWVRYCDEMPTEALLHTWARLYPHANPLIPFGPATNRIAWDIDGPEGLALLTEWLDGDLPDTLWFPTPGGGRRLIYSVRAGTVIPATSWPTKGRPLTLLGRGSYSVAPGGMHPSGRYYEWPEGVVPVASMICPATPQMLQLLKDWKDPRNTTRGGDSRPPRRGRPGAKGAGDAVKYVLACEDCVAGEGGNWRLFHVLAGLARKGFATAEQMTVAAHEYNRQKCFPPWEDAEVERVLRRAMEWVGYTQPAEDAGPPPARQSSAARRTCAGPVPINEPVNEVLARVEYDQQQCDRLGRDGRHRGGLVGDGPQLGGDATAIGADQGGTIDQELRTDGPAEDHHPEVISQRPTCATADAPDERHTPVMPTNGQDNGTNGHADRVNPKPARKRQIATQPTADPPAEEQGRELPRYTSGTTFGRGETEWLWEPYFPYGGYTLLGGDSNAGKTAVILSIVARITTGRPMPFVSGRSSASRAGNVLLVMERDPKTVVNPRLFAEGADLDRVQYYDRVPGKAYRCPQLPGSVEDLRAAIRELHARFLVIDPLSSTMLDGGINDEVASRRQLEPLAEMLVEEGVACIATVHLNKKENAEGMDKLLGSKAMSNMALAGYMLGAHPERDGRFVMSPLKNSVSKLRPEGVIFRVEVHETACRLIWDGIAGVGISEQVASAEAAGKRNAHACAKEFLAVALAEGERLVSDLKKESDAAGHTWSTILTAKAALGIKPYHKRVANKQQWYWKLPKKKSPPK